MLNPIIKEPNTNPILEKISFGIYTDDDAKFIKPVKYVDTQKHEAKKTWNPILDWYMLHKSKNPILSN